MFLQHLALAEPLMLINVPYSPSCKYFTSLCRCLYS